ncbi:MAG TPA: D-alanyl-D-alanine carboxypeptidase [Thermodesulfobacteriota bacterium]|nr:D-alanyl-D-alanine carboxypeptidase [Thermodesulfobacteriota bacterium]
MRYRKSLLALLLVLTAVFGLYGGCSSGGGSNIPADIRAIFNKAIYDGSIWGLRVVDLDTGEVLIDLKPDYNFFIGSVRKVFSVGELLNEIGPDHLFITPIYKEGEVDGAGVLDGNLYLVASGDISMGGRTKANGQFAISNFDHNEADSLGNAVLTKPNPLKGYKAIAQQIADSGITQVDDVVIDDRLFQPFPFRNEGSFAIRPIFVNDDCVDLIINPTSPGMEADVDWRPKSAALGVVNDLVTTAAGTEPIITLEPEFPECIGQPGCTAEITGQLPVDLIPPFTNEFPLIRTFRIVEPQNYARTVLIRLLEDAGVTVLADSVAENPVGLLPPKNSYSEDDLVTTFVSFPYADYAKLILKVSYNIGADTSLLLWGVTQGVDNMDAALAAERENLTGNFGIPGDEFFFIDGSGGGDTTATNRAVTKWLEIMTGQEAFDAFFAALPILGVDGSLGFVTDFEQDPTLAGAKGQVRAKTGTFAAGEESGGILIKGQAFGGYIDAKSGRRLVYQLVVNNVPIEDFNQLLDIFQDEGTISAILWRDY